MIRAISHRSLQRAGVHHASDRKQRREYVGSRCRGSDGEGERGGDEQTGDAIQGVILQVMGCGAAGGPVMGRREAAFTPSLLR
jgi:hypothetical protein